MAWLWLGLKLEVSALLRLSDPAMLIYTKYLAIIPAGHNSKKYI